MWNAVSFVHVSLKKKHENGKKKLKKKEKSEITFLFLHSLANELNALFLHQKERIVDKLV